MVLVPNLKNTAATYNWILNLKKYLWFTETDNANILAIDLLDIKLHMDKSDMQILSDTRI